MCSRAHCTSLGPSEPGAPPPGCRDFWEQEGTSLGPLGTLEAPFTTSFRGRGGPPTAGSRCPTRSLHAGPSLATLPDHAESGGPRDPSGSACDLCKHPRSGLWIPGSVLPEPFCTLSPGPPPLDTGPHPPGAHDALGLPGVLPALLQPCMPAVSISPFPAPWLGQAWVSGYLAGRRPSSQLVQPPILWSGVGHGPQLCKQHVAQLLLGQRTDAHSASHGNTRLCRMPARCAYPRRRPVSARSGSA